MSTDPTALQAAIQLHQSGQLAEALEIYRRIIAAQPSHAEAWHLSGVASLQQGNVDAAIEFLSKAVALDAKQATSYCYLAEAYWTAGRGAEAEAALREAIWLRSGDWK